MSDSTTIHPASTETTSSTVHAPNRGIEAPTGVNLLLVIIYGSMVVLLVVLFVQRLVQRIAPKFSKGYADVGRHAPKALRENIDKRLMQTLHVVYEPRLLNDGDDRCGCLVTEDGENETELPYNYLYRMKAVDDMKRLEEALCRTDESLKRPPLKDVKQHLRDVRSHSSGVMKNIRGSQMKILMDMYEHARYKPEHFGKKEYEKFTEVLNDVLSGIEHKSRKKRSKKQHSQRNVNNSCTEGTLQREETFSENEPLITDGSVKKKQ